MCGALEQSGMFEAHQTGLLQSTHRPSHLCTRVQLAANSGDWLVRNSSLSPFMLVEYSRGIKSAKNGSKRQKS